MPVLCSLINNAALIYGGITDYKRREIPNLVPVTLLATGFLSGDYVLQRLLIMVIVAIILWLTTKITKQELPGGDFKLICALTFSVGLLQLLLVLFLTSLEAVIAALVKKGPVLRNIPLCTYVGPANLIVSIVFLFLL